MLSGDLAAAAQQLIKHAAVQLQGPVLVGVGQGGAFGRVGQPQAPKQHGHELAPAGEPAGMTLGPVLHHGPLELSSTQTVAEFHRRA